MRPKIVILTLVAAFAALGLIALLKGVAKKGNSGDNQSLMVQTKPDSDIPEATNQFGSMVNSSNRVVVSEQLRAALVEKELDLIRDILGQADGTNNPVVIAALIEKLSHPEAEVRQSALDALKQLDDTNAVPGLEKALETVKDAREKVAMMDVIEYIKMPSITENAPPELATNLSFNANPSFGTNQAAHQDVQYNPNFINGNRNVRPNAKARQAAPPNAPVNQPQ